MAKISNRLKVLTRRQLSQRQLDLARERVRHDYGIFSVGYRMEDGNPIVVIKSYGWRVTYEEGPGMERYPAKTRTLTYTPGGELKKDHLFRLRLASPDDGSTFW